MFGSQHVKNPSHQPVILLTLAFTMLGALLGKHPEFLATFISILGQLGQNSELTYHLDTAILRNQLEIFQNLIPRILAGNELAPYTVHSRPLSLGMRIRFVFAVAATDISVIVPTLNEGKYLPSCLSSLSNQSWPGRYQIIVVDGGSTDRTVEVARKYADKVLVEPGKRVGAARNIGAKESDGDILAFIDADTCAGRNWLSAIDRVLQDSETLGVTGPTLPYEANTLDTITYTFWTIYLQRMLLSLGMPHVIGFNCAYRKDPFLRAGGFDENTVTSEDIQLARRMSKQGRIVFEKEMFALTSPRRFRTYGHAYIAGLYLLNGFSTLLLNKSTQEYPPVR